MGKLLGIAYIFILLELVAGAVTLCAICVVCTIKRNELKFTMGDYLRFLFMNIKYFPLRIREYCRNKKNDGGKIKQKPIRNIYGVACNIMFCVVFYWFILYRTFEIYRRQRGG